MKRKSDKQGIKSNSVPWIVFLFSISVVLISFVSVMFPALILVSDTLKIPGIEPVTPDPYEPGVWAGGVLTAGIITFGLAFLYFKNKLPQFLEKLFAKIWEFELSKKSAFITLLVLLIIYTVAASPEISEKEIYADYAGVSKRLESWSLDQITSFEPHVRYLFLKSSVEIFGNDRVLPLLASAALLIVTYFFTKAITQKRFAGIISVVIIMQSSVFLTYDTTVSYTNFWILFYLLSLLFVYRFWPLSPVSYFASLMSKALTATFLPMSIYFILRCEIPRKQKAITTGITAIMILVGGIVAIGSLSERPDIQEEFNAKEFWMGFTSFSYQLRFDGLVMLFTIPLMVGLFLVSKKGVKHAESIMVLISGILLTTPFLTGFTAQTNQPYRFVPLVVFFAVGVGVLLSKRQVE